MTTSTPGNKPNTVRAQLTDVPLRDAVAEIPAWLLGHPTASPGAKLLYGAIAMHVNNGRPWPETEALADLLHIAERTVRAHLRELVLIGAVHRKRGIGYHTGKRYQLRGEAPNGGREGAAR